MTGLDLSEDSDEDVDEKEGKDEGMVRNTRRKERGCHVIKLACGWDHCLALSSDGVVRSWGSGQNGKLGRGTEESAAEPMIVSGLLGQRVVHIAAGCEHSIALTENGVLYTWGHGDGGRLGRGDNVQVIYI